MEANSRALLHEPKNAGEAEKADLRNPRPPNRNGKDA